MDPAWSAILGRITAGQPVDLDPVIRAGAPEPVPGAVLAPAGLLPPAAELWQRVPGAPSHIGVRVRAPLADPAAAALRLAAAAVERRVIPVILSRIDSSGFERFGFRVERIPGGDEAAARAAEDELRRFWNLALVIEGAEISLIG